MDEEQKEGNESLWRKTWKEDMKNELRNEKENLLEDISGTALFLFIGFVFIVGFIIGFVIFLNVLPEVFNVGALITAMANLVSGAAWLMISRKFQKIVYYFREFVPSKKSVQDFD